MDLQQLPETEKINPGKSPRQKKKGLIFKIIRDRNLLLLALPGVLFLIIFRYIPILGNVIAFQNYDVWVGFIDSEWVGFKHFIRFLTSSDFFEVLRNTFLLGLYDLVWSFPMPIIFALFLNEVRCVRYRKFLQTVSYLPHFLSIVVVAGMVTMFLSPSDGLINIIISKLGMEKQYFLIEPRWFRTIYISSGIWQHFGFSSIIFIAALTGIDPALYESAEMDGCKRLKKMWYISIPGILPTLVIMFILSTGRIMRIGFQKVLLLYNPSTYEVADIIATYVYRFGLEDARYSYAAAVGLFNSVISLLFVLSANWLSRKVTENSLW